MAKPYQEGEVWSFRLRINGEDVYETGFSNKTSALKALDAKRAAMQACGKAAHGGPWRMTLAQALLQYGLERLPFIKGARQESGRINKYLRAANLPTLQVSELSKDVSTQAVSLGASETVHWSVETVAPRLLRSVPQGLTGHRQKLEQRTVGSDKQRKALAQTKAGQVLTYQLQGLVDALNAEGLQAATVAQERALLRNFFNYARKVWHWADPLKNPATDLKMPAIDNARTRILSNAEWRRVSKALETCDNPYVAPAVALLLETAMRASEALVTATWADFDWKRCVLHLKQAKSGQREVPFGPQAMSVMQSLKALALRKEAGAFSPESRILPITYEAMKAAWRRACERAGVEGVRLHDLRHTCATRFSLEYHGNLPVLKVITGHKTDSQLMRYINIKPDDVVRLLQGKPMDHDNAPAGLKSVQKVEVTQIVAELPQEPPQPLPSNVVPLFRSKKVA